MDLPRSIFKRQPRAIARGLKASVLSSRRTKGRTKFQSALNLYINHSGAGLARADRRRLAAAKEEASQGVRPAAEGPAARSGAD